MKLTDRRGVDVVLNALAAEAIPMGFRAWRVRPLHRNRQTRHLPKFADSAPAVTAQRFLPRRRDGRRLCGRRISDPRDARGDATW